jgi:hypothetical protein
MVPRCEQCRWASAGIRRDEMLPRAFEYWRNIDKAVGDPIEAATRSRR